MKRLNFRITLESGAIHSGVFTVGLSKTGNLEVRLQEFRLGEGSDFTKSAWEVRELLWNRVIQELSSDIDSLHFTSVIDIVEAQEKEESHAETEVV